MRKICGGAEVLWLWNVRVGKEMEFGIFFVQLFYVFSCHAIQVFIVKSGDGSNGNMSVIPGMIGSKAESRITKLRN